MYQRNNEHLEVWKAEDDKCPLQCHSNIYHNEQRYSFNMKIVANCYGKPSNQMIREAVWIGEIPYGRAMNNKN